MTTFAHDWGSLPGDSSSTIADIETSVKRLATALDNEDQTYQLGDVRTDLEQIRELANRALDDIAKAPS